MKHTQSNNNLKDLPPIRWSTENSRVTNKKLAIFSKSMQSGGGLQRVVSNLAAGIAKRGYSVDFLALSAKGPYMQFIPDNVRIIDFSTSRTIITFPSLVLYLRREKPGAMYCADSTRGLVGYLAKIVAFSRVKIIIGIHASAQHNLTAKLSLKDKIAKRLTSLTLKYIYKIIPVSNDLGDEVALNFNIPKEKIQVIYNPVINDGLRQLMHEPVDHPWLDDKSIPVVLAAGRLEPQKDFETLIRAFHSVISEYEAHLIIIGEGGQRRILTDLIHELDLDKYIDLPGFVGNPYSYMNQADLFVLSSRFEGFGNVIVEAMACGCPIVSADCPSGPREILENGKYGKLVPVGDHEALAEAILQSLLEDHNIAEIEERAEFFSEDRIIDEYLSLML